MRGVGKPGRVHAGALLTGWAECSRAEVVARQQAVELVRCLAPRYEKVLQEVYKPVGTSRDFTRTCAFPFGPASEFKLRLIETVSRQRGGLN